ncbi:MAG: hypothetical protein IT479_13690 [Xanthomonadales bacterium]|nr:hypothetical protein [Xanthomonadales bacterium]
MKTVPRARKPSSKARRKRRRATLKLAVNGAAPTLVCAQADGVEALALAQARALGLAHAGFVPSGTRNPGETFEATPTRHPAQALKWNTRFADATVVLTADAVLHGRARLAVAWCRRYRKPWLHLYPAAFDEQALRVWLRTRPLRSLHICGARAHQQVERLEALLDVLLRALTAVERPVRCG